MGDTEEPTREPRRRRNLLQSYYGVNDGAPETETTNDPTNLDSASFDATKYFEGMLRTNTLSELVTKDNEMVTEIKTLDGDMKTLVYENYNKFISATDTIRKMKSNVESMEEEMSRLSKNMDTITGCSSRIDSVLSSRREKIDQLAGIHRLLQKLQFLVALPGRLQQCVDMEAYAQAVKYFNITSGILRQYNHIPSFGHIQSECESIVYTLRNRLRQRITDPELSMALPMADIAEATNLLIELKDPIDQIRITYLAGRRLQLETLLRLYDGRDPNTMPPAGSSEDADTTGDEPGLVLFMKEYDAQFLSSLVYMVQSYKSLFVTRTPDTLPANVKQESQQLLDGFTKETFARFLAIAKQKLAQGPVPKDKVKGLEILYKDVARVHTQLPQGTETGVDRVSDVVISTVNHQIEVYFSTLQDKIARHIATMAEDERKALATPAGTNQADVYGELAERTAQDMLCDIQLLFENLKPFFQPTETRFLAKHYPTVFAKIQVKLQGFFLFLTEYLDMSVTGPRQDPVVLTPRLLLLLVSVSLYLENKGLPHVMGQMQDLVNHVRIAIDTASGGKKDALDELNIISFNAPDLAKRFRDSAHKVMGRYVQLQGGVVSNMLRKGVEVQASWLKMAEPRGVRPVVEIVVDEVTKMGREVEVVLGQAASLASSGAMSSSSGTAQSQRAHGRTTSTTAGTTSDLRRTNNLFDKREQVFAPPPDFTPASLMAAIIKIGLKTLYECIRLRTFGRNGYQQVQVDVYFLRGALAKVLGARAGQVGALLEECENSCAERCLEPTPMDTTIIAKLCEPKLEKKAQDV